jgi:hypothetical protein
LRNGGRPWLRFDVGQFPYLAAFKKFLSKAGNLRAWFGYLVWDNKDFNRIIRREVNSESSEDEISTPSAPSATSGPLSNFAR